MKRGRTHRALQAHMAAAARARAALARLNPQAQGDFTNAIIASWAHVGDILSFYRDRIADEGYLATATEPVSVELLAAMVGARQRPALAAQTDLALQLVAPVNRPDRVTIDLAHPLVVQNVPEAGGVPVVFESLAQAELRAAWNAIPLAPVTHHAAASLWQGCRSLRLAGVATGVRAGQALLVTVAEPPPPAALPPATQWLVTIDAIVIDRAGGSTIVSWDDPIDPGGPPWHCPIATVIVFEHSAGMFGRSAPAWADVADSVKQAVGVRPGGMLQLGAAGPWRDARAGRADAPPPPPGDVRALAAGADGVLFAGTPRGLWRSEDGGAHWAALALPGGRYDVQALHQAGDRLYAGTGDGLVLMSSDAGDSWTLLPRTVVVAHPAQLIDILPGKQRPDPVRWPLATPIRAIIEHAPDPSAAPTIAIGTDRGVFAMALNDLAWHPRNAALPGENAQSGAADVSVAALAVISDGTLVAATAEGVFTTDIADAGGGWTRRHLPLPTRAVTCLARAASGATLFVGTAAGVVATQDFAVCVPFDLGFGDRLPAVHALAALDGRIHAATDAGVFRSRDSWPGWTPVDTQELALFATDPRLAKGLDLGQVTPLLRARFARFGTPLAADVAVAEPVEPLGPWQLRETSAPDRAFHLTLDAAAGLRVAQRMALPASPELRLATTGQRLFAAVPFGPVLSGDWPELGALHNIVRIERRQDDIAVGSMLVVQPRRGAPLVYAVRHSRVIARKAFGKPAVFTRVAVSGDPALAGVDPRTAAVYFASRALTPCVATLVDPGPLTGDTLTLAGAFGDLAPGRRLQIFGPRPAALLIEADAGEGAKPIAQCPPHAAALLDQAAVPPALVAALAAVGVKLSAASVTVQVPGALWLLRDDDAAWRITRVAGMEPVLTVTPTPIYEVLAQPTAVDPAWTLTSGGAVRRLPRDTALLVQGATTRQRPVAEIATIVRVVQDVAAGTTSVTLSAPLAELYDPVRCRVGANVVRATQGETVTGEVLGGGTGVARQRLALHRAPLTWHFDPMARGVGVGADAGLNRRDARPALTVAVDGARVAGSAAGTGGVAWREVPFLALAGPTDRVYELRLDAVGRATLRFGDGRHGALLPNGADNVAATYRTGAGAIGNVPATTLSVLRKRPPGIRQVTNPVAATGGTDAESIAALRKRAPIRLWHGDRIVVLDDYAAFAEGFAGVGSARVALLPDVRGMPAIWLVATTHAGAPLDPASPLGIALAAEICARRADRLPFQIVAPTVATIAVALDIDVDPGAVPDRVIADVRAALASAFGPPRTLGDAIDRIALGAVVRAVAGVGAVDLRAFHRSDQAPALQSRIAAASTQRAAAGGGVTPAELLSIDGGPHVAVTVRS